MIKLNKTFSRILFYLIIFLNFLHANESHFLDINHLIGIVKVESVNYRSKPSLNKKYIKGEFTQGTILEIDSCDKYNWCKIKNEDLFVAKQLISIMKLNNNEFLKKIKLKPISTKIENKQVNTVKKSCQKLKTIDLNESILFNKDEQDTK